MNPKVNKLFQVALQSTNEGEAFNAFVLMRRNITASGISAGDCRLTTSAMPATVDSSLSRKVASLSAEIMDLKNEIGTRDTRIRIFQDRLSASSAELKRVNERYEILEDQHRSLTAAVKTMQQMVGRAKADSKLETRGYFLAENGPYIIKLVKMFGSDWIKVVKQRYTFPDRKASIWDTRKAGQRRFQQPEIAAIERDWQYFTATGKVPPA